MAKAKRTKKTTRSTRSSSASKATHTSEAKDPFTQIFEFYVDQFKHMAPTIKKGIEDQHTFTKKLLEKSVGFQKEIYGGWFSKKDVFGDFSEQSQSFAEKIMLIQKEMAIAAVDVASKSLESFRKKENKSA